MWGALTPHRPFWTRKSKHLAAKFVQSAYFCFSCVEIVCANLPKIESLSCMLAKFSGQLQVCKSASEQCKDYYFLWWKTEQSIDGHLFV